MSQSSDFSPEAYRRRIAAANFSLAGWARHCGVSRDTVMKQVKGAPEARRVYWLALSAIDGGSVPPE